MTEQNQLLREALQSLYDAAVGVSINQYDEESLDIALGNARTALTAQPAEGGEAVIDLTCVGWEAIQDAAAESPWIPPQYFQNDWVSDVCSFLREPRTTPPATSVPAEGGETKHVA